METPNTEKRIGPEGPLYDLLIKGLPDFRLKVNGLVRLDVLSLAKKLSISHEAVYKCVRRGRPNTISVPLARKFVELSEHQEFKPEDYSALAFNDFEPFLK